MVETVLSVYKIVLRDGTAPSVIPQDAILCTSMFSASMGDIQDLCRMTLSISFERTRTVWDVL